MSDRYLIDVLGRQGPDIQEMYEVSGGVDCETIIDAIVGLQEDMQVLARTVAEIQERLNIDGGIY